MERELVVSAQHGDETAFASIVEQMVGRYQSVAFNILRDRELAEDATQQALLRMWRKLPRLRDPDRFTAWSYRLLVHACYKEAKRSRSALVSLPPTMVEPISGHDDLGDVDDRDQLERGFARLSLEHRTVVVLRYYLDFAIEDIATVLDIPAGTAKSRLHHAVRSLRAALEADERPAPILEAAPEVPR